MALIKQIQMDDGVTCAYHRVALVSMDVNSQNTVLVVSYIDRSGRQYELDWAAGKISGEPKWPYTRGKYHNPPYQGAMSVSGAYAWLKTLPEFEGAEDDGGQDGEVTGDELMAMIEEVL